LIQLQAAAAAQAQGEALVVALDFHLQSPARRLLEVAVEAGAKAVQEAQVVAVLAEQLLVAEQAMRVRPIPAVAGAAVLVRELAQTAVQALSLSVISAHNA
jgi:hypothetical protein